MAARKNRGTIDAPMQDDWKNKIKASAILNRLNQCVEGTLELSSNQLKAADIILKKIVPDLARTEIDADIKGNLTVEIVRFESPPSSE